MRTSLARRRRAARSASDSSWTAGRRWMSCLRGRKPRARRSSSRPASVPGGSTRATSRTWTATCGRSSGTRARPLLEFLVADDAAGTEEAGSGRRRLRRGGPEHFLDDLDVLLGAGDVAVAGRRPAQPAVHGVAGAELHPGELDEIPGGEVGRDRREERRPVERQREEPRRARELRKRRLHHRLLVLTALEVRPRRVEPVLPDARVDERRVAVHVLHALVEAPALPLLAARRRRVRTVEAVGEDVLRRVDVDAADGVDELLEGAEVDDRGVVDRELRSQQLVHRLYGEPRSAELHCSVDLLVDAVDRHPEV